MEIKDILNKNQDVLSIKNRLKDEPSRRRRRPKDLIPAKADLLISSKQGKPPFLFLGNPCLSGERQKRGPKCLDNLKGKAESLVLWASGKIKEDFRKSADFPVFSATPKTALPSPLAQRIVKAKGLIMRTFPIAEEKPFYSLRANDNRLNPKLNLPFLLNKEVLI